MRMRGERQRRSGMARLHLRRRSGRAGAAAGPGPRDPTSLVPALRTLVPFIRPHWRGFVPAILAVIGTSLVALIEPWPLKFLIDDVLHIGQGGEAEASTAIIAAVAAAIVGIAVLQGLLGFLEDYFLSATSSRVAFRVRRALFSHLQRLSLGFHDRQRTGDIITRVTSDVTQVQELATEDLLVGGLTSALQFVGILAVMMVIDWRLGLVALAWAPLVILTSSHYRKRIKAEEWRVRQHEGDMTSLAQETMSSIRVVKAFGREHHTAQQFERESGGMLEASVVVARLEARMSAVMTVLTAGGLAGMVFVGAHQVLAGALSAGTLVVFIAYMAELQSPLNMLSRLWARLTKAMVRMERIVEVFDERPAVADRPGARPAPRFRGHVRLERLSFGYEPGRLALENVDLEIRPGEVVAVVGPTGAGKTTLASLLLRLYDPFAGAVLIDGRDVRDYKLQSVVDQVAVVLQESLLFQTTIRENIAYGNPVSTFEDIREAARTAYCEEFIEGLPHAYDTVVGERGGTLSGGQRQRLAIARAVVRDAPILVLDEPTTGLDAEAEAVVMQALERLMEGRATLMIAHKLSTVRSADRIYVLGHGRVVEEGTHDALVANGGPYARALRAQHGPGEPVPLAT
jgi:ATP-binding cassette subfamily B protein